MSLPAAVLIVALTGLLDAAVAQRSSADTAVSARELAPVDLTGYWVSVISEDWAWRMRTPPKGDYASLPLNDAGRRIADQWNPADAGSCLGFGAVSALRVPTRIHVTWVDANTLQIRTDNGMQTRRLHFADTRVDPSARLLQGHSRARWVVTGSVTGSGATGGVLTSELERPKWASLEVVTTNLESAWLRPNGVPHSRDAVLTEYFDRFSDGDDEWFTVTVIVEDPAYLTEPLVVSPNFKREPDDANWKPRPCRG